MASGTGTYMIVFMMMAVGLNIVVGYAGLLDLGYVAFYAIGAYVMGWFASGQFQGQKCSNPHFSVDNCPAQLVPKLNISFGGVGLPVGTGGIHLSIFLVLLIAGAVTALFGILIGLPTLRLRGDYLAIVTLGFGEILPQIARNGDNIAGWNLTNGALGITPIDQPGFGNHLSNITGGFLPASFQTCCNAKIFEHQISTADLFYWFAILLLVITVFVSLRLRDSRLGRAWIAIREDETAAAAMGIPLMRTKTWAYAGGAFFGGVAGAYYASAKDSVHERRLLLQHLGVHPLHGHPRRDGQRVGRAGGRRVPRLPEQGRARRTSAPGSTRTSTCSATGRTSTFPCTSPGSTA